ncbi:unnamed protein product [Angiostrongylus costaricensis]|uniref:F-box domain-containing protein n=1 Tax=Angiostrongylus costaricensis TaxID=334426 RepID=A0A0R3PRI1_ANGCS|nr:unnamed protein product [Angiostrongylus costaricensis]
MLSITPNEGMLMWLPSELLLLIFSHIRGRHLVYNVRLVCKKFHSLLANQHWWLSRIQVSFLYVSARFQLHRWKSWYQLCFSLIVSGHIATVDAIRLFSHGCRPNMFCLSGGRDRAIKLWNIGDLQPVLICKTPTRSNHWLLQGWIWCLDQSTCSPDHFLSCSWDCTVKMWQITPSEAIESAKLGSACMCLSSTQNGLAACSTFAKKVFVMDTRNSLSPVLNYWSMDYVRSICLRNNQLICGTHQGLVSTLDPLTLNVCSQLQVLYNIIILSG